MAIDLTKLTCVLWKSEDFNFSLIESAIKYKKGKLINVIDKTQLINLSDTLIFIDEDLIDDIFFDDEILLDKLEKLNLYLVIVGLQKKLRRVPPQVHFISKLNTDEKEISAVIDIWQHYRQNLNKREQALTVKLNRLFYIYHVLFEGEYLFLEDIMKMASVSKRTILRDLKTLREVLVTKQITFDEEKKAYLMEDIK